MNSRSIGQENATKLKLHLACGTNVILDDGWTNIDLDTRNNKNVTKHDLSKPLPFKDNSVDMIFHEHFIEHLPKYEGHAFLRECYRVLRPGGSMRVGWPDMGLLIRAYTLRDKNYFNYVSTNVDGEIDSKTWDELIADFFYSWEHRYGYTRKQLKIVLAGMGFQEIKNKKRMQSDHGFHIDLRNDPATSYIEAVKQ